MVGLRQQKKIYNLTIKSDLTLPLSLLTTIIILAHVTDAESSIPNYVMTLNYLNMFMHRSTAVHTTHILMFHYLNNFLVCY